MAITGDAQPPTSAAGCCQWRRFLVLRSSLQRALQRTKALLHRSIRSVDHDGVAVGGVKRSIDDFGPSRSARSRWASLHPALMLSAVRAGHCHFNEGDARTLGDVPPSLTCNFDGVHRIGNHGPTQFEVVLRDSVSDAVARATSHKPCSVVGQQNVLDGVYTEIGRLKPAGQASSEGCLPGSGQATEGNQHRSTHLLARCGNADCQCRLRDPTSPGLSVS
jgi:hypothetical protein